MEDGEFKWKEFAQVYVKEEAHSDLEDIPYLEDVGAKSKHISFESDPMKCGDVMVGQEGNFSFICALCSLLCDSMQSFGFHIQEEHMHLKIEEITIDEVDSLATQHCDAEPKEQERIACLSPTNQEFDECFEDVEWSNIESAISIPSSTDEFRGARNPCEFTCGHCTLTFPSKVLFLSHIEKEHCDPTKIPIEKDLPAEPSEASTAGTIICKYCDKIFVDQGRLEKHIRKHKGPNRYTCPHCPKKFAGKNLQIVHIAVAHNGQRPFVCKFCQGRYSYAQSLRRHLRRFHTNESGEAEKVGPLPPKELDAPPPVTVESSLIDKVLFTCNLCPKKYANPESLRKHFRVHKTRTTGKERTLKTSQEISESRKDTIEFSLGSKPFACPYCARKFDMMNKKLIHINVVHGGQRPYACDDCPKTYGHPESLARHLRKTHKNVRKTRAEYKRLGPRVRASDSQVLFACDICPKTFGHPESLRRHVREHKKDEKNQTEQGSQVEPDFRQESAEPPLELQQKEAIENVSASKDHTPTLIRSKPYKCPYCPMKFDQIDRRIYHIAGIHTRQRPFVCQVCTKAFSHPHSLRRHNRMNHESENGQVQDIRKPGNTLENGKDKETQQISQTEIDLIPETSSLKATSSLEPMNDKTQSTPECKPNTVEVVNELSGSDDDSDETDNENLSSHTQNTMTREERRGRGKTICPFCFRIYSAKMLLITHLKREHNYAIELPDKVDSTALGKIAIPVPQALICRYCNQQFDDSTKFKMHVKHSHPGRKKFPCFHCSKLFSNVKSRQSHMNTHTNQRPYKCSHCPKAFNDPQNLLAHTRSHLNIKLYKCQHCDKSFVQRTTQVTHERLHTGERPYQCETCGGLFKTNADRRRPHGNCNRNIVRTRDFKCDECEKAFYTAKGLKDHKQGHGSERPFRCDACDQTFSRLKSLRTHQQLHSGVKKYVCKNCGQAFAQAAGLYSHKKSLKCSYTDSDSNSFC